MHAISEPTHQQKMSTYAVMDQLKLIGLVCSSMRACESYASVASVDHAWPTSVKLPFDFTIL